ncbi:chromosome segregation protein SMC [Cellulomonas wangsupingiae]|uniref:Chromosome partition protein Smc n=1 Tax=Cellulomonas wangsupingiae TaxID=2968085 RepID=A0ABY5K9C9_9CELL|nr:chromosome segregation protein SMC [Cellulomonas wangsupingiae]UUI66540.1 chromosome segregation protein SMC [Cellulomonas wangsupingiae]
MHLKTLTLRGFKSFASATTLSFEPGITCVVGPNGSGKSNVVDALAWVMGEQGAKSLRGGKMEDVIFAGTSGRPPLGRAEVSLTIDNADGALPIEYSEVTISRTLFRNGGSEYAINGRGCRLLDIQDLLSDSGLGREMHVIVGQGQLDAVLRATPEERRGFIEEAAGVLKHRKRKEKALRKLDSMQGNLTRLGDLTAEIRRQLGPLGRQAEVARKAAVVQADLRDARARLLADDLAQLRARLEQEIADESAVRERREQVEADLAEARGRLGALEQEAAQAAPAVSEAGEVWYRLSSLRERVRGTVSLAADRARLLGAVSTERSGGPDPDDLAAQAQRVRTAEAELAAEVDLARAAVEAAAVARQEAEAAATAAERALADLQRSAADRREGVARLAGQVAARRSRVEATEAEIGRLRASLAAAEERAREATTQFTVLETQVAGVEEGEEGLDAEHEAAAEALDAATVRVAELEDQLRAAERERDQQSSRAETLEMSLDRKDGAGALLAAEGLPGVIGSVAALLSVEPRDEEAVVAALGAVADAVAVESVDAAVDAIRHLRTEDAGRATLMVAGAGTVTAVDLPPGVDRAVDLVQAPAVVQDAVRALLADVVVVDDLAAARPLVAAHPHLVVATRTGDVLCRFRASGGSASAPSALHLQAALDTARATAATATSTAERLRFELATARETRDAAQADVDATLERLNESDAALAAVAEQLGHLGSAARAARAEAERVQRSLDAAGTTLAEDHATLAELTQRLAAAQDAPEDTEAAVEQATARRDAAAAAATAARGRETEARLTLRTGEERARALAGRAESLERAAAAERSAREKAARREQERASQAAVARAVHTGAAYAGTLLDRALRRATDERDAAEAARTERDAALSAVRARGGRAGTRPGRADRRRAQGRGRARGAAAARRAARDARRRGARAGPAGPARRVRPAPRRARGARPRDGARRGRAHGRALRARRAGEASARRRARPRAARPGEPAGARGVRRARGAAPVPRRAARGPQEVAGGPPGDRQGHRPARGAGLLGRLPRHRGGVRRRLPAAVPRGRGPPGAHRPRRHADDGDRDRGASGGQEGQAPVAAVGWGALADGRRAARRDLFKARPSPFYVMDEVEAALDDANLGRLLEIFRELQDDSQLIVVTHQKRTMEIADALYGVTMRGDGVTTVISQRMAQDVPA